MNYESTTKKGRKKIEILFFLVVLLGCANFFVWKEVFGFKGNLEVTFFAIGQGDSIFIETPEKHQILIDGGPSRELILEKLAQEMPFWDRTIDLVVLTHPDVDHRRGIESVLDRFKVGHFLLTEVGQEKLKELGRTEVGQVIGHLGTEIKAGRTELFVLSLQEEGIGQEVGQDTNDSSLVIRLDFLNNSFLFTGDISSKIEKEILNSNQKVKSDVLKVAHHGSKTSSSAGFIETVSPTIAVISCGKNNPYNHPHPEVLKTLDNFAIKVLRTDIQGDIEIISDGNNLTINN
ncbi:MBL fold metallo-hydrolase [Candidatus Parcubacteria bacterium]|nr:MBL fold metallo-hydrolase [Candidatus Parcubacteria bacterium]